MAVRHRVPRPRRYISTFHSLMDSLFPEHERSLRARRFSQKCCRAYLVQVTFARSVDLIATKQWLGRTTEYIKKLEKQNVSPFDAITGDEAAKIICLGAHGVHESVSFSAAQAGLLKVKQGQMVSVVPSDSGK